MSDTADVVIIGGGIGGAALAISLARGGLDVLVLERQPTYRDKVRGETLEPWGVAEAVRLGVEEVLLDAGGGYCKRLVEYVEGISPQDAEARAIPLDEVVPDIRGSINAGHPESCEALAKSAVAAGARMARGVGEVLVEAGPDPNVRYELDDVEQRVACRLVVGADGRNSTVRRQMGFTLNKTTPRIIAAGLLVEGLTEWPLNVEVFGTEADLHYLVFPRPGGRARLYLMWDAGNKHRFTGPQRQAEVLNAYRLETFPGGNQIAESRPAGPCANYPMNDTWIDEPFREGVVLIGDAAGWNDPIIGQGLAIALRDARMVSEIVRDGNDWRASAFRPYAEERRERMRRLRLTAELVTDIRATFTPHAAARRRWLAERGQEDPLIVALILAGLAGPETVAEETFSEKNFERIRALH